MPPLLASAPPSCRGAGELIDGRPVDRGQDVGVGVEGHAGGGVPEPGDLACEAPRHTVGEQRASVGLGEHEVPGVVPDGSTLGLPVLLSLALAFQRGGDPVVEAERARAG
jgi:hypothetical protein